MDTDLIRDALTLQASRAPDAGAVLHTIRRRSAELDRRRRRTRMALAAAGTTVAVTTAPVLISMEWREQTVQPAAGVDITTADLPRDFPLLYRPTWLPSGLREATSQTRFDRTSVVRRYTHAPTDPDDDAAGSLTMTVTIDKHLAGRGAPGIAEPVLERNTASGLLADPPSRWLTWTPEPGIRIDLLAVNLPTADELLLKRVASSIVIDEGRRAVPLHVGWWPGGVTPTGATVSAPGLPPRATIAAGALEVSVLRAGEPGPVGTATSVAVGGRAATLVAARDRSLLTLDLPVGAGLLLRVTARHAPLTVAELTRVAESTEVDAA
jgi:hypothetical protein